MSRVPRSGRRKLPTALTILLLGAATALAVPGRALAQDPPQELHHREGFWIAWGFGPSYLSFACDECSFTGSDDPWRNGTGSSLWLSMGGAVSSSLLVGAGFNAADIGSFVGGDGSGRSASQGGLLFLGQYYPRPASGLYLKGGFGFGSSTLDDDGRTVTSSNGWLLQAGAGHDFRFGGRFGLAPYVDAGAVVARGATRVHQGRIVGLRANPVYLQAGLGLAWY